MKKHRLKQKIIDELANNPTVSAVCEKLGLSRQTFYRWIKEDERFASKVNENTIMGNELINDIAEMKLLSKIKEGNMTAIKFRLENNKHNYIKPRYQGFWETEFGQRIDMKIQQKVDKEEREKLKLELLREIMDEEINNPSEVDVKATDTNDQS